MRVDRIPEPEPVRFEREPGARSRDLEPEVYWSRRSWLLAGCGLGIGIAGGAAGALCVASASSTGTIDGVEAWQRMLEAPEDELIQGAHELELRSRSVLAVGPAPRLLRAAFERLLVVSLQSPLAMADDAGAAAARTLVLLGDADVVKRRLRLVPETARPRTRAALRQALEVTPRSR